MTHHGQTAIVTGGSSGIGRSIVERFLADGYRVAFCGSTPANVDQTADTLARDYGASRIRAAVIDLSVPDNATGYFDDILSEWKSVGAFVHNAAVSPKRDGVRIPLHETEFEQWRQVMNLNLASAFLGAKSVLPGMTANGYGRIVLIGSIASRSLPKLAGAPYVSSKSALTGLMRSIVSEYSAHGVTANCVAPGNIRTNMTKHLSDEAIMKIQARVPLGRMGEPEDIAGVVAALCSPAGNFVNGATIDANGGEQIAP